MKVAVVHDWLVTYAGAERVLEQILQLFPDADLYSLIDFVPEAERGFLGGRRADDLVPAAHAVRPPRYRQYLPAHAARHGAVRPLGVRPRDLQLPCGGQGRAHRARTDARLLLCYSPMRYAWDLQHQYLSEAGLDRGPRSWLARYILHRLRLWDYRTANGVDEFLRQPRSSPAADLEVLPPRIDGRLPSGGHGVRSCRACRAREDFYVDRRRGWCRTSAWTSSSEAFAGIAGRRLVVLGDGPEMARVGRKPDPTSSSWATSRPGAARPSPAGPRVRLRRPRGLRHRAVRGAGLRHAGHRLWPGRRARDRPRAGAWPAHRSVLRGADGRVAPGGGRSVRARGRAVLGGELPDSSLRFSVERFRQRFRQEVAAAVERFGREGA